MISLVEFPQFLGNDGVVQDPIVAINFPSGSSLAARAYRPSDISRGGFFGGGFERVPVYSRMQYFMEGVYFVPSGQERYFEGGDVYWVPEVGVKFSSIAVFIFKYGEVGMLLKSL